MVLPDNSFPQQKQYLYSFNVTFYGRLKEHLQIIYLLLSLSLYFHDPYMSFRIDS